MEPAGAASFEAGGFFMQKSCPKILIVDDAPDFCEALAELLEAEGYACRVAANGKHAIELLPQHPPDLVILDWEMPIMNGAEFLRNRILHTQLRGVPVIVVSAQDVRSTADLLGASFLLKPFSFERLLSSSGPKSPRRLPSDEKFVRCSICVVVWSDSGEDE